MEPMVTDDDFTDTGTEVGSSGRNVMNDETGSVIGGFEPLNLSNEIIAADGDLGADELHLGLLKDRAVRRFLQRLGAPSAASTDALVKKVTLLLLKLCKEAVHD
eukprot:2942251-Prymnesium_polylepis.2